jgi:hypothetical protein
MARSIPAVRRTSNRPSTVVRSISTPDEIPPAPLGFRARWRSLLDLLKLLAGSRSIEPVRIPRAGRIALLVSGALVVTACDGAPAPDAEATAEAQQPIEGGEDASPFFFKRAAALSNCTATVIASRFLLTAAHCQASGDASFYDAGPFIGPSSPTRGMGAPIVRSGVHPGSDDYVDASGHFADLAIVELDAPIPSTSRVATLAWHYPSGGDEWGTKVGAGNHHEEPNGVGLLRTRSDQVYSDNDDDGHFLTENWNTNHGDSGGAFFDDNRVLGTLWGHEFEWEMRNKYTSVPFHLNWILRQIDYQWPGQPHDVGRCRLGDVIDVLFDDSELRCQYACDHTDDCVAYTLMDTAFPYCTLLSNVDSNVEGSACKSARK